MQFSDSDGAKYVRDFDLSPISDAALIYLTGTWLDVGLRPPERAWKTRSMIHLVTVRNAHVPEQ